MAILNWLQLIAGTAFLFSGIIIFFIQIIGVFKFHFVLNRMHAAAMGDTLGIGLALIGLMILSGWNFTTLKMALVIVFLWCSSPVASHLIARLEETTNENLADYCELPAENDKKEEN